VNPASSETTFAIRPYRPADFELLWQIDQQCFLPGIAYTQLDLTGFITRRNAITLVADVEERAESAAAPKRIAGFVVAQPSRGIGQILTLDVAPQARRMGLATRLMEETEQRLRARGCREIYLETAVSNEAAIRLYHKLGYTILRTLPEYYSSHSLDAFLLGKLL